MELSKAGETVDEYWLGIPGHISNIELGAFVVMPNHLRGIIILQESPGRVVVPPPDGHTTGFQSTYHISTPDMSASTEYETRSNSTYASPQLELDGVTRSIQRPTLGQVVAYFKYRSTKQINLIWDPAGIPLWQRNYYDHIIRNEEEYERIYAYIESNPVNWKDDNENPAR
ncbi:MAG: hypothetical protein E4G99_12925 [Anaerolineales bacterium]|nr:MAG: hypothetical protein E4G99_12925 [Anaerolineales bacterium]